MGAYHQLGHQATNLVLEPHLNNFAGVILSPVNFAPEKTRADCAEFRRANAACDIIFDPQMYVPSATRGELSSWRHMPGDIDTADQSSAAWWGNVTQAVIDVASDFSPNAICSPAPHPRIFDNSYYELLVQTANELHTRLAGTSTRPILTALVGMDDVGRTDRHLHIGSILSRFAGNEIYLVLTDNSRPRQERRDSAHLEGACRLIQVLSRSGFSVIVGFSSSEMLLWKTAGATHVASGKYFNTRRFTLGRWDDDGDTGGRNLWYWFEPSLLAFLREADLRRLMREDGAISPHHSTNPYSAPILQRIADGDGQPWQADSWRQYLYWFADCERQIDGDPGAVSQTLQQAEEAWAAVSRRGLLFEEAYNNGEWIRIWRVVVNELRESR